MATTVLVSAAELSTRKLLARWLIGWGFNVKQAASVTEAHTIMVSLAASIVLVDIKMPGEDALWLMGRIREKWPRTAIIVAGGVDELETLRASHHVGAVDYVSKPFGRELLWQALNRAEATLGEGELT